MIRKGQKSIKIEPNVFIHGIKKTFFHCFCRALSAVSTNLSTEAENQQL